MVETSAQRSGGAGDGPDASPDCFHCGEPVPRASAWRTVIDGAPRPMCCAGCAAVAQAIVDHGLAAYYRQRSALPARESAVPAELRELTAFDAAVADNTPAAGAAGECTVMLEGITCAACVWLIEQRVLRLPGVLGMEVNFTSHRARLRWDPARTRLSAILAAINAIGYRAWPYERERAEALRRQARSRALLRLFVAGFGMMQVMMYLVPAYLADGDMTADVEQLMRIAGMVLTAPVVFYAAAPFFAGAWRDLRNGRPGMDVPVALGIGAAFAASVLATVRGAGVVYFDSVTMFVFLLLGARYFEATARARARAVQEELALRAPLVAERLAGWPAAGGGEKVPARALRAGDFVRIAGGAAVPADGVLVDGTGELDEALLTGEARPQLRRAGDVLTGGSYNLGSPLVMRVTGVGAATRLAGILRLADRAAAERPRLAYLADRVARGFVAALLVIAAGVALVWSQVDPAQALAVTVAVLVVSCPCALSLATPAALAAAAGRLQATGVLVTRGNAIEGLARATDVVFDKTGTLTSGRMQLVAVEPCGREDAAQCLALAAALEAGSLHPAARALVAAAPAPAGAASGLRHVAGAGVEGTLDGRLLRIGTAAFVAELTAAPPPAATDDDAHSEVLLGDAAGMIARFRLADGVRPEAAALLAALRAAGLRVHLASGDRRGSVEAVARELGIASVLAAATPAGKAACVQRLQQGGAVVVMVGDGVNDAAGLGAAQVSVALGSGADAAAGASDVVLLGGRLDALAGAFATARRALAVIRQNLAWAFAYNATAIPLAACGMVTPLVASVGMAGSSALVVANALRLLRRPRAPR